MADGSVTIVVITLAMRREGGISESETFAVMRGDRILATDKHKPENIAPVQWARDYAAHEGVPFVEPDATANFAMHPDGTWFAYSCDPLAVDDEGLVRNRTFETKPPILFRNRNRSGVAA